MLSLNFKQLFTLGNLALFLAAATQSHAAAVHDPSTEPVYVLAPYATSATDVSSGTVKAYRPWFENGAWQGDLVEYDISAGGLLSTTVDSTVSPPTTTSPGNWSAQIQFNAAVTANPTTYWDTGRKIIFHNGSAQKAFDWPNLTSSQQTALDSVAAAASAATSDMVDYLRGDQSNETDKTGGVFRQRYNLLGDIIHSNPVYVGSPDTDFSKTPKGYADFRDKNSTDTPISGQADRAARVYVGANDGMVHAFDAATGNEVWAYIPSMIIGDLDKLAAVPFTHTYFVDGQLNEGDADFDSDTTDAITDWHSLLVGGLGSGGKGLFALDITDANLSSETANTGTDKKILWEKDGSDTDMGYIHGKSQIARLPGGKWVVITGNGYGSTSGLAKLLLIDKDGVVTKVSTDGTTGNGLSAPTLIDVDNDSTVDYGYAGDLKGNLWKFNFNTSPSITVTKLFAAGADKPITTEPEVRIHPNGGYLIYFATGSLLSAADATNTSTQSAYGIWDGTSNTSILTQTLSSEDYSYTTGVAPDEVTTTITTRTATNNVIDWSTHKGWQVDFNISGERVTSTPILRADRLQFVSHNPLTPDRGDAWLLELNFLNGGTGPLVFLDLNRDGNLDLSDKIQTDPLQIPLGINIGKGSFSGPVISRVTNSRDTMFINGLFLPQVTAKTENTHFQGGHIDVDTDSPNGGGTAPNLDDRYCYVGNRSDNVKIDGAGDPIPPSINAPATHTGTGAGDGLGGATDGHYHEYDIAQNQVYVDYINLEPTCSTKLNRVTEVGISDTKKFLVLIANADLSPGSTLQIGAKKWNVVVYQKMLHEKLDAWIAAGKNTVGVNSFDKMMVDNDGDSLQYDLNSIIAAGTLRNAFDDRAILDGGLIPTQTGCVKSDPYQNLGGSGDPKANTGRWRGGALVTQLIGVTEYLADTTTIVKQTPTDLYVYRDIGGVKVYLKEDKDADGVYETYLAGGLRARDKVAGVITSNPAFLFESTLFWHYKGSCYGTANWAADVKGALNSSSTTSLKDQLTSLEYDLSLAEAKYAQMVIDGEKSKQLKKQQKLIDDLKQKIQDIKDALKDENVANSGVPTPPTDVDANVAPALGPNFRSGRRTWIDLTP